MRKTKIICTLGPATDTEQTLQELILAGMNVARFNLSHGSHEEHKKRLTMLEAVRKRLNLPIGALLDTKGPEIRLGNFKGGRVELKKDEIFTLTTREVEGDNTIASISYQGLVDDIKTGTTILLDDGLIGLTVLSFDQDDIVCKVLNSGVISDKKGINLPGTRLSMPFISPKDKEDIIFGIKNGYDFIAASFTAARTIFWRYVNCWRSMTAIPSTSLPRSRIWTVWRTSTRSCACPTA